ncbi:uncharacterized protein K441DRAFT_151689 [Cenococcum geophilum 1.58]|uniref:uncharacterized protein n=1 Tax=Cenococcum geophilum 1.58 TaxID=794803 RepID=UPI00358ED7F1|nr:hypothetical protein K441DRAFT_151689 [Cenococcum geophilum 1.58]
MGCCLSHASTPSSPYPPAPDASTSSPPHASSLLSHAASHTTPCASHTSHAHDHAHARARTASPRRRPSIAPNTPLKPLNPAHTCALPSASASPPPSSPRRSAAPRTPSSPPARRWTAARLARERADFFDTRVTGRAEVWGVVRLVVELVRAGEVAEAQGVLDAAGCTCPTGEVWRGVFDERGEWYKVPEWVVVEPGGLVEEGESEEGSEGGSESGSEEEEVKGRREGKGKGRAVEGADGGGADKGPVVKIRARLSDRGTDVVVKVGKGERVGVLVRRVREVAGVSCFAPFILCGGFWGIHEVSPGYGLGMWEFLKLTATLTQIPHHTRLKIGYLGRLLHEHESLAAQGWREGHVVNALVFQ